MKNIMVDLETLGNNSQSVILSIGAVEFDETGLGSTFYMAVDPESCVRAGLMMDVSTVMWWMKQSDEARAAFDRSKENLAYALTSFSQFVTNCAGDDAEVWGNGATFDNVILDSAYRATGQTKPWKFWNDRCYRTLKNLYPQVPYVKPNVAHNALEDAIAQARHASQILREMRGAADHTDWRGQTNAV